MQQKKLATVLGRGGGNTWSRIGSEQERVGTVLSLVPLPSRHNTIEVHQRQ